MELVYISNWLNGEGQAAYLDGIGSFFGVPGYYYVAQGEPGQLPIVVSSYTAPPAGTPAPPAGSSPAATGGSTAPSTGSGSSAPAAAPISAGTGSSGTTAAKPTNSRRKQFGPGFQQEIYTEYGTEYVTPNWFQGQGYYEQISEDGTLPVYRYLGAENPDAQYFNPTANGRFMFDPATGQFVTAGYNPYSGGITGAGLFDTDSALRGFHKDTSLAEQYGPLGRDRFLANFYAPYANVPGVRSPDEFINASYRSQQVGDPTFDPRYEGVFKGSDNKAEAGSANNPTVASLALLNAYMNQPALVAARGGQAFDWSQVPQLQAMYDQGQEIAGRQAQMNHDVNTNTSGFLPGLSFMDFLKGMSLGMPLLGPLAGGAINGGLAGLEAAAGQLAAPTAAQAAAQTTGALTNLGLRGLNIVSPELGQIAGIAQGLNNLPGAFGGGTLTGMLGGGGGLGDLFGGGDYGMPSGSDWSLVEGGAATDFAGGGNFNMSDDDIMRRLVSSGMSSQADVDALRQQLLDEALGAAGGAVGGNFNMSDDDIMRRLVSSGMSSQADVDALRQQLAAGAEGAASAAQPAGDQSKGMSATDALSAAQRVAGLAKQVAALIGDDGQKAAAQEQRPAREQGQTDREYAQEVADWAVKYLDIDSAAMAKAGLQPGSPEYLNFILEQANSVISQIFSKGGLKEGETVQDLQTQLGDLTKSELRQLDRALFVRGELGKMMGAGDYFDPFSGRTERVEGAGQFNAGRAAYQRGVARSVDELAGLRGSDARQYLGGMLGRKADLYGLQATADANMLRARLLADEGVSDEERRRRMAAADKGDWASAFGDAQNLNADALFYGVDTKGAQAALMQAIFGE